MLVAELSPYGGDGEQRFSMIGADISNVPSLKRAQHQRGSSKTAIRTRFDKTFLRFALVSVRTRSHVQSVVILVDRASSA
jgi:hypothetical protein